MESLKVELKAIFVCLMEHTATLLPLGLREMRKPIPPRPANCPFCDAKMIRVWVEVGTGGLDRFFLEHAEPLCRMGLKRTEAHLLTPHDKKCLRHWALNGYT